VLVAQLVRASGALLIAGGRLLPAGGTRHEDLQGAGRSNRTAVVPIVPNRGLILDRNGMVLATNYSAYTLEITPSRWGVRWKTIDDLAQIIEIQPRDRRRFKKLVDESKSFESLPIRTRLTDTEVARLRRSVSAFPAWKSRHGCSATTPSGGGQPRGGLHRPHQPDRKAGHGRLDR
jgi:penicillin-binding protein 2